MSDADNQVGGTGEPFSKRDQDDEPKPTREQKETDEALRPTEGAG